MNILRIALMLLILAVAHDLHAAGAPLVRTRIAPASVVIGQPVTLSVDILVPTWFAGGIDYPPTITIPEAVAKLSDEHSVNLNERIGDASYAGMTKTYVIVPQKAGAFEVPAFTIRVPYSVDGKTVIAEVRTAPQRFEARLPAGAQDLGYFIATRSYRLTQQVEPSQLTGLKVGDAVTRRIVQRANDLAPMFLPALKFEPVEGLEIYSAEPVLDEQGGQRGTARVATRTDAATYVLAQAGRYRLPGLRIGWFDPGQSAMRWAEVPDLAFDVASNPTLVKDAAAVAVPQPPKPARFESIVAHWKALLATILSLLVAGLALGWLVPVARRRVRDWRARRSASEAAAFRHIRIAARRGDAASVRRAAVEWCARLAAAGERMTLSLFARNYGDDQLTTQIEALDRLLYRSAPDSHVSWSTREFVQGLTVARRRWRRSRRASRNPDRGLVPLNPALTLRQERST